MKLLIKIAKKADIPPGMVLSLKVESCQITIFNVDGNYCSYAVDDKYTHSEPPLSEEVLKGNKPKYEVVIEGDDICVFVDECS